MEHVGADVLCVLVRTAKGVLARIAHIEKSVLILVLFVDGAHEGRRGWQDLVNENENGLFRRQLDSFSDDVDELTYSEVL